MSTRHIRITHQPSGLVLAEGPTGWGITPFEGNYYIGRKYLRTSALVSSWIPGLCPYKGLYVWLDVRVPGGERESGLGWFYWLPNPLLPFIWFRVALWGSHPDLLIEELDARRSSREPILGARDSFRRKRNDLCTCKEER